MAGRSTERPLRRPPTPRLPSGVRTKETRLGQSPPPSLGKRAQVHFADLAGDLSPFERFRSPAVEPAHLTPAIGVLGEIRDGQRQSCNVPRGDEPSPGRSTTRR